MLRGENVFYNLVTDENSTTELLCNLLRFSAFRMPFLRLFLSEAAAAEVAWEDFDTQVDLGDCGRPDIEIKNLDIAALIEVKVAPTLALTANQPHRYLDYLRRQAAGERWLVFLVPRRWIYLNNLRRELAAADIIEDMDRKVRYRVILWEDVLDLFEDNDLATLNPFMHDFRELLRARLGEKCVTFTTKEILMLFSNEVPTALASLQRVVDGVRDLSSTYKVRPSASRSLCPSEYGLYFLDAAGKSVLWFGVWTDFWKATGTPLCFGLTENCNEAVRQAFLAHYNGATKHFGKYILGWPGPEILSTENAIEQIWLQLSPLVDATLAASLVEQQTSLVTETAKTPADKVTSAKE